ncbi:MAG: replication-relaxation family protein [Chloroflexi bacterium]|nr:replication-relaxation family protein [Chloroflexota bacterium]
MDILFALSLKGYRYLTCRHLSGLYFQSSVECQDRMAELCQSGMISQLSIPAVDGEGQQAIYTLARSGANALAKLKGTNPLGLASLRKPSYLFLEHGLRVSDFMCSLEAGLKGTGARLLSWKSERQLKTSSGRALRVAHPFDVGEKIPIIPDGLFSLKMDQRVEHFFLEADRGTMSLFSLRTKMLGYIQLFRKRLHLQTFGVPDFRVLLVTNTPYRRDKLREELRGIGYCPNMFWFAVWRDITPERVLGKIWLKCRDRDQRSLLE